MLIYVVYTVLTLGIPFDLYVSRNGKRIVGEGRNIAGVFFFIFVSIFVTILQQRPVLEGLYLGAGGICGCIVSSFIKRRLNRSRGSYFFLLDQTDFILGASLFYASSFELPRMTFLGGLFVGFILHHGVNLLRKSWEMIVRNCLARRGH